MFNALFLTSQDGKTQAQMTQLTANDLPKKEVLIDVSYSSLNYKDGLAITGKGRVVKQFPMIPGIDSVGVVESSEDPRFSVGDEVIVTGWGVGEAHWGGMSEKMAADADWLVKLPKGLTAKQSMMIGTAGLTAMLCVQAIIDSGVTPEDGEILVTGASGGVGSVSITLLNALGYKAIAVTGRAETNKNWLMDLGASRVLDRSLFDEPAKPLEKQQWKGAIDTTGSKMLAKVLAQMDYNTTVAACGLAAGFDLPTTVMPFILRNVRLQGVDSVYCPTEKRLQAWDRLVDLLPSTYFEQATQEITLDQVPTFAEAILNGEVKGRVVVNTQSN